MYAGVSDFDPCVHFFIEAAFVREGGLRERDASARVFVRDGGLYKGGFREGMSVQGMSARRSYYATRKFLGLIGGEDSCCT